MTIGWGDGLRRPFGRIGGAIAHGFYGIGFLFATDEKHDGAGPVDQCRGKGDAGGGTAVVVGRHGCDRFAGGDGMAAGEKGRRVAVAA